MSEFEVEQKLRVEEFGAVRAQLLELGAVEKGTVEQSDTYFAHPQRDFAATDEAFRLRRIGSQNRVTYKGPKRAAAVKNPRGD